MKTNQFQIDSVYVYTSFNLLIRHKIRGITPIQPLVFNLVNKS